jgi:hypothetical protein
LERFVARADRRSPVRLGVHVEKRRPVTIVLDA